MNDGWKIVQGLKKRTQNYIWEEGPILSEKTLEEWEDRRKACLAEQQREADKEYNEIPNIKTLDKELESQNIELLKECIKKSLKEHTKISGNIEGISFFIDDKKNTKISFFGDNYNVTIDGEDVFSEVDFYRYANASYIKDGHEVGYIKEGEKVGYILPMTRTITVINGEEFSESYRLDEIKNKNAAEIIEEVAPFYKDYVIGDEDELYRTEIDPNQEIKTFFKKLPISQNENDDLENGFYVYHIKREKCKTYGEYAIPAKKIEDNCKYLYSLIIEAYKSVEKTSEKEKLQDSIKDNKKEYEINKSNEILNNELADNVEDIVESDEKTKDDIKPEESINLNDKTVEELESIINQNEEKITENDKEIKEKLIKKILEQQKTIKEQEQEIEKLNVQKEK